MKPNKRAVVFFSGLMILANLQIASAETQYVFPVAGCKVTYSKYRHDYPATDIQAKQGCAFVATIAGRIEDG